MNHVYRTHVCKDPLITRGLLSRMSHVCRTHVCTDSLVARVTIGRKEAPFRMSHVYTCVQFRRTPRTHVCNFGGLPYTCVQFRRTPRTHVYNFGGPLGH